MQNTLYIIILLIVALMVEVYILTRPKKGYGSINKLSMLVDTSVLMDGRVVDLAKTGFLLGQVVVPKSVLAELQLLADGSDHNKRERARLGMDSVKQLQDTLGGSFELLQDSAKTDAGVDERLIELAKQTDSAILTLDYNLNKVAQVEGISVLNINELAKSLRMMHLPGDKLMIELTQKGQSNDQAVGYLSDGTMVVVEQGKKSINQTREVEIIRSLQTDAGKMMFAKLTQAQANTHTVKQAPKKTSQKPDPESTQEQGGSHKSKQRSARRPASQQSKTSSRRTHQRPKSSSQREANLIRLAESQD